MPGGLFVFISIGCARNCLTWAGLSRRSEEPLLREGCMDWRGLMSIKIETPLGQFKIGTRVRKKSGSSWQGRVVGYYSTALTPIGYAVESEREPGSVQIYPAAALQSVIDGGKEV